ncbi:hypothetical protein BGX27_003631 [Mortierella sp. AM989]|nr:hypothetical protein BGX27_003631 [Mortierella sp. AM989]
MDVEQNDKEDMIYRAIENGMESNADDDDNEEDSEGLDKNVVEEIVKLQLVTYRGCLCIRALESNVNKFKQQSMVTQENDIPPTVTATTNGPIIDAMLATVHRSMTSQLTKNTPRDPPSVAIR